MQNAPVYRGVADAALAGAQGVSIEVTDTASGSAHARALVDGAFDLGHIGVAPLVAALGRTRSHVIVGTGLLRHPPHSLIAPPGVHGLREVAGRPVALNSRGTCSEQIFLALLAREHLRPDEVAMAALGDAPAIVSAIRRDEIGAAILWEPYTSMVLRELGWTVLVEGAEVWTPSRYCTLLYARRTLVEESPALVAAVMRAYAGCVRASQQDTASAAQAVVARMPHVPATDIRQAVVHEAPRWCADTSLDRDLLGRALEEPEVQARLVDGFRVAEAILPC